MVNQNGGCCPERSSSDSDCDFSLGLGFFLFLGGFGAFLVRHRDEPAANSGAVVCKLFAASVHDLLVEVALELLLPVAPDLFSAFRARVDPQDDLVVGVVGVLGRSGKNYLGVFGVHLRLGRFGEC